MTLIAEQDRGGPGLRNDTLWGSDRIAELLRALGIDYISLTPGSSFRGLHDSLVNHLGNVRPELLLCIHEESAVALAHGYAKVTGRPMAVALHANIGLMHGTMAIFNAWCDRMPMLILGAAGPFDARLRRPNIDWQHTSADLAALVRHYTKWDNQPGSVPAAVEALLRAHQIAATAPLGPVFVCLDQTLQEEPADAAPLPDVARFRTPQAPEPGPGVVRDLAARLEAAQAPLLLIGRGSNSRAAWEQRVRLAEALSLRVLTDLKVGAKFPTRHPLHAAPPALSATPEALALMREADLILSLDWIDLGGTLLRAFGERWPQVNVVHCSLDQYSHNGWSMDHQALPATEMSVLADPDRLVDRLVDALADRPPRPRAVPPPVLPAAPATPDDGEIGIAELAEAVLAAVRPHRPSLVRLPFGWRGAWCDFADPLDYLGYDGAGGIGSGPGMAVGSALALRGTGRLPVAVIGDGDFLMGATALWTAVRHGIPLLLVLGNNRSFFNDEIHQEHIARQRGRPVDNRGVGIQLDGPAPDLAMIARAQGCEAFGPVREAAELQEMLSRAAKSSTQGRVVVVDVHIRREYGRPVPSTVPGSPGAAPAGAPAP